MGKELGGDTDRAARRVCPLGRAPMADCILLGVEMEQQGLQPILIHTTKSTVLPFDETVRVIQ
jgi:hypothetical protein